MRKTSKKNCLSCVWAVRNPNAHTRREPEGEIECMIEPENDAVQEWADMNLIEGGVDKTADGCPGWEEGHTPTGCYPKAV